MFLFIWAKKNGLVHRILVLMVNEQKPNLNILANLSSEIRGLNFGFNLHAYSVYASSDLLFFSLAVAHFILSFPDAVPISSEPS